MIILLGIFVTKLAQFLAGNLVDRDEIHIKAPDVINEEKAA